MITLEHDLAIDDLSGNVVLKRDCQRRGRRAEASGESIDDGRGCVGKISPVWRRKPVAGNLRRVLCEHLLVWRRQTPRTET